MMTRRRQHGFTFLEILLAMAMVSMLGLSLYTSLRIGFKARDSAARSLGPVRAGQVAMEMIREDLESALPPTGVMAGTFIGQRNSTGGTMGDTVEFYCVGQGPEHATPTGWGGMRKIELGVTSGVNGSSSVLVRRITSNLLSMTVSDPDEEVICRGVRSFTLRYWDGYAWQETWDSTQLENALPEAVEATLEIDWPEHPKPGIAANPPYRMVRVFPLSCYRDLEAEAANGSSSGGATGGGATGGGATGGGGR